MLTEKQIALIEEIVTGDKSIEQACKDLQVSPSNYYYWRKNNKAFQQAMDEAIEIKVEESKKKIRMNINKYINRLDKLSESGRNEVAKINAITKLLDLAELFNNQQEIVIKSDDKDEKNYLLSMLDDDKKEETDKKELH